MGKTAAYDPHLSHADGIIVVLDVTRSGMRYRKEDVEQSKSLLKNVAREPEVRHKPFLVFANKCDREDAVAVDEVKSMFDLEDVLRGRPWQLHRCSAVTGEGIKEGLLWLVQELLKGDDPKEEDKLQGKPIS